MRPERRAVPGLAQALPALEASLEEDVSPRNRMKVAEAFWLAGRPERAVIVLESLVRDDPSLIAPRVLLTWCYEDAGRLDEARRCRGRVGELDPANPYAVADEAALPESTTGPVPELRPESEPASESEIELELDTDPPAPELEAEPERALTEEELREIPPGPLYSATLAEIFAKQGFQEKAIEIYRELERADPERSDVRQRIRTLEELRDGTRS